MLIRNAIFDLDGTLVDSMPYWRRFQLEAIRDTFGVPLTEKEITDYCRHSKEYVVDDILKKYGKTVSFHEHLDEVHRRIGQAYMTQVKLKSGARDYLRYLKESGCGIALATSTKKNLIEPLLVRKKIDRYFDAVVTAEEVGISKYRSPAVYDTALAALGADKADTVIFEDLVYCVRTAKAAGYYTIAVRDAASRDHADENRTLADRYIRSFFELLP